MPRSGSSHASATTLERIRRCVDDLGQAGVRLMLIVVLAFLVLPIGITVLMSFDDRTYLGPLPPPALSLRWFTQFFSDPYFINGLATSVAISTIAVAVAVACGVAAAVALNRSEFPGKQALIVGFMSPLIVPPVVIGFALLLFLASIGITNGFVRLVCGHIILTIPYTIRATLAGLAGIDRSLTEAALALGATERRAFWDITFPLARTGIISGAIFAFAVSMDDVAVSIMLTDARSYTLPIALISSMRANFDLTIAAASTLLMALTIVLVLILDRIVGVNRVVGQGIYRN